MGCFVMQIIGCTGMLEPVISFTAAQSVRGMEGVDGAHLCFDIVGSWRRLFPVKRGRGS